MSESENIEVEIECYIIFTFKKQELKDKSPEQIKEMILGMLLAPTESFFDANIEYQGVTYSNDKQICRLFNIQHEEQSTDSE